MLWVISNCNYILSSYLKLVLKLKKAPRWKPCTQGVHMVPGMVTWYWEYSQGQKSYAIIKIEVVGHCGYFIFFFAKGGVSPSLRPTFSTSAWRVKYGHKEMERDRQREREVPAGACHQRSHQRNI